MFTVERCRRRRQGRQRHRRRHSLSTRRRRWSSYGLVSTSDFRRWRRICLVTSSVDVARNAGTSKFSRNRLCPDIPTSDVWELRWGNTRTRSSTHAHSQRFSQWLWRKITNAFCRVSSQNLPFVRNDDEVINWSNFCGLIVVIFLEEKIIKTVASALSFKISMQSLARAQWATASPSLTSLPSPTLDLHMCFPPTSVPPFVFAG